MVEQITKERQHAVLSTNCNPNPRKKYFDGAEKPNSEHATEEADETFRGLYYLKNKSIFHMKIEIRRKKLRFFAYLVITHLVSTFGEH